MLLLFLLLLLVVIMTCRFLRNDKRLTKRDISCMIHPPRIKCASQVAALRSGLATIVPLHLLQLFTGEDLEVMVCGRRQIDIELLRTVTEYSGCSASDEHVKRFWEVLESFDHLERAMFLKFTWGRSRLPLKRRLSPEVQNYELQNQHE